MLDTPPITGRFAPSPTGPLHFGSLIAALGSYLAARSVGGRWLVRMEDVDRTRTIPGAADGILNSLRAHGLHWDGTVMVQTERDAAYQAAMDSLLERSLAYPCSCNRKRIMAAGLRAVDGGWVYPAYCRNGPDPARPANIVRLRVDATPVGFEDQVQGGVQQCLETDVGDFPLRRGDGLFAYQLAVVVDDGEQGVTQVVRGSDLLDSTPRQIALQRALGLPQPDYLHLPVATHPGGNKLSKQTHAPALDDERATDNLWLALNFLGQSPPLDLRGADVSALLRWALDHWDHTRIPGVRELEWAPRPAGG
ncbi:MAG: tRNA glutamyl-Q(34) synthetase GluQRS [Gammaproteobacteria bacterium]